MVVRPEDVDICYYHGNCHDGALAAAIVKQKTPLHCEFVPTWWESLPNKSSSTLNNKIVLFVDLTPSPTVLAEVVSKAKAVFIIDHHESARSILLTQLTSDMMMFDVRECGATLAWKWVHGVDTPQPLLVQYIKALDVFDWSELTDDPHAMSVSRCIEQLVSPTVADMEDALSRGTAFLDSIRSARPLVDTVIDRQIDRCIGSIEYYSLKYADRVRVAVVNVQHFINHVAHRIYSTTHVHVVWIWYKHGSSRKIRIMLRSNGRFDCQRYAHVHGGGGHPNAAMFTCDRETAMWDHMWS